MLAIILHKKTKIKLNKGTIVIPVPNWEHAKLFLRKYLVKVRRKAKKYNEDIPEYITLFKIPDECKVCFIPDSFLILNEIIVLNNKKYNSVEFIQVYKDLVKQYPFIYKENIKFKPMKEYKYFFSDFFDDEKENLTLNHFILGENIGAYLIKWTKNIRALYEDSKKLKSLKKYAKD
jgi:hypothetical protein